MEEKQIEILRIAIEEFSGNGYYKAKTDTVAERANVSKGLVFHYFKTKKNLYYEAIRKAILQLEKIRHDEDYPTGSLIDLLEYTLKKKFEFAKVNHFETQLLINVCSQLDDLSIELKEEIENYIEEEKALNEERIIQVISRLPRKNGIFEEDVTRLILMVFRESEKGLKKAMQDKEELDMRVFDQLMFEAKKQLSILETGFLRENRNFSR